MEDNERIDTLERQVVVLTQMIEALAGLVLTGTTRGLALADLLTNAGIIGAETLAARMRAMDDEAELAVEFGSELQHEAFRRLRRAIQERMDEEADDNDKKE